MRRATNKFDLKYEYKPKSNQEKSFLEAKLNDFLCLDASLWSGNDAPSMSIFHLN